jgi:hypothetical protein
MRSGREIRSLVECPYPTLAHPGEESDLVESRTPSSPLWSPWQLIRSLLLYSVPLYGVLAAGWSWGTLLALFWCENLLSGMLAILLMGIYRLLLWKAPSPASSFLKEFIPAFLACSFGAAAFLGVILYGWLGDAPGAAVSQPAVLQGVKITAFLLLGGFVVDLSGLRKRSFAWVRRRPDNALAWTALMLYVIFFGTLITAVLRAPKAFFWVFLTFKLAVDLGAAFSPGTSLADIPSWGPWLFSKVTRTPLADKDRWENWQPAEPDQLLVPVPVVAPIVAPKPPVRRKRSPRPNRHSSRRNPLP